MTDLSVLKLSRHFAEDRSERMEQFKEITAWDGTWGKVIAERDNRSNPGTIMCLTTKGIVAIVAPSCNCLMTAFLASMPTAKFICYQHVPPKVAKRIEKNAEVFRRLYGLNYEDYCQNFRKKG